MDKRYLNAFLIPPKYNVGGIELDIFCPRHYITLEAVKSPFVEPNPKHITFKDLFIAMRICSTKCWEDAIKEPNIIDKLKYYSISSFSSRQSKAFESFGRYMSESMSVPKIWLKDNNNNNKSKENLPKTLSIVVCLITKFGFSENDAWNMPFSRAVWYVTAYASQEGAEIEVITTESEEKESSDIERLSKFEKSLSEKINIKNRKVKVI